MSEMLMANLMRGLTSTRLVEWLVGLAILSYVGFYIVLPDAYAIGPMVLALMAIVGFRWSWVRSAMRREDVLFASAFAIYFVVQCLLNLVHGTDISEYDMPSRFLAAALILTLTLRYCVSEQGFFATAALGVIIAGGIAIYQSLDPGSARAATFDNPIHYGNGAVVLAVVLASGLIWATIQQNRLAWGLLLMGGILMGLLASVYSGTRSGWLALPVVVVLALVSHYRFLLGRPRVLVLFLTMLVVLIAGLVQVDSVEKRIDVAVEEFDAYFDKGKNSTSVGLRLDMWKGGWEAFVDNPFLGAGEAGYQRIEKRLIEAGEINQGVAHFRHLHNQYVDAAARGGLLGLAALLYLFLVPFLLFLTRIYSPDVGVKALAISGALFMTSHAVFNLTQSMLERNIGIMMFLFMPIFIWSLIAHRERRLSQDRLR